MSAFANLSPVRRTGVRERIIKPLFSISSVQSFYDLTAEVVNRT